MSSVRLSRTVLAQLHQATPRGVPLSRTLETLLELAGGAERVRTFVERGDLEEGAAARVARLRLLRDPGVVVRPPDQVALARSAADQVRSHTERSTWLYDGPSRRLLTTAPSSPGRARPVTSLKDLLLRDAHQARLFVAAWATDALRRAGVPSVVVGGTALDAYLAGTLGRSEALPGLWLAGDPGAVSIACRTDRHLVPQALTAEGFRPARLGAFTHAAVPAIPVAVAPAHVVAREDRVVTLETEVTRAVGLPGIPLQGPEELVLDYVESAIVTRHQRDWVRALALAEVMRPHLDVHALRRAAEERAGGRAARAVDDVLDGKPLDVPA